MRRIGLSVCLWLSLGACNPGGEGGEARGEAAAEAEAKGAAPDNAPDAAPAPAAKQAADAPVLDDALAAAIEHAIVKSSLGDATTKVDPFVVAWLVEAIESSGSRWLSRTEVTGVDGITLSGWSVRVPAGSLLEALGLEDGDVIEAVSGVPATEVEAVRRVVAAAENQIELTVFRDDVTHVRRYVIAPHMMWKRFRASLELDPAPADEGGAPAADEDGDEPTRVAQLDPSAGGDPRPAPGGRPSSSGKPRPATPSTPTYPKPSTPSKPPTSSGKPKSTNVRCESGGKCYVKESFFDAMVSSPSKLQSQASVVPAIQNDVHSGYKLKSVKSGSAVHQLGFRSGDKITHVNGYDLTSDAQALALYMGLGSMKSFKVRYVRGGKARTKTVALE